MATSASGGTSSVMGSLTTSEPGCRTSDGLSAKVTTRSLAGSIVHSPVCSATRTEPSRVGAVPSAAENCRRSCEPPRLVRTIMRRLWSLYVGGTGTTGEGGGSGGKVSAGGGWIQAGGLYKASTVAVPQVAT